MPRLFLGAEWRREYAPQRGTNRPCPDRHHCRGRQPRRRVRESFSPARRITRHAYSERLATADLDCRPGRFVALAEHGSSDLLRGAGPGRADHRPADWPAVPARPRGRSAGPAELSVIRDEHVGSVWFTAQTLIGLAGIRAIADAVQAQVNATTTADVGFYVAAKPGGRADPGTRRSWVLIRPLGSRPGGERSSANLTADAQRCGQELRAAGVNLDFAPVFDVVPPGADATNRPIGVLEREYGHDPATAGNHAAAFVAGMTRAGVATTAKHFPGLGRVAGNTDVSAGGVDTVTTAHDPNLESFRAAITAGAPFVMVSLATYTRIDPMHLAAFSPLVIGGLLRGDLGFRGWSCPTISGRRPPSR